VVGDGTSGRSVGPFTIFPRTPEVPSHAQSPTTTLTRMVTVAAGMFAPGHLGELTQYLPFELVDDVLARIRTVQRGLRVLLSRAGCTSCSRWPVPCLGYARVIDERTAGLAGMALSCPSETALCDPRRRLGPAPLKSLFEGGRRAAAPTSHARVCSRGCATVAFDGLNALKVPTPTANRRWMGRIRYRIGFAGYPALRRRDRHRGLLGATIAPPVTGTRWSCWCSSAKRIRR
jgi:hypothetical protein